MSSAVFCLLVYHATEHLYKFFVPQGHHRQLRKGASAHLCRTQVGYFSCLGFSARCQHLFGVNGKNPKGLRRTSMDALACGIEPRTFETVILRCDGGVWTYGGIEEAGVDPQRKPVAI